MAVHSVEELFGHIERITFQNNENGYTVAQLQVKGRKELICIVGVMPMLQAGETVRCQGQWKQHLVYGQQFTVETFRIEKPADILGIKKYLSSGLIKGIGSAYAERIVEKFGLDTLEIIDRSPQELLQVEGLGKKRVDSIKSCWSQQKSIRDVMIFLQAHGVSPGFAQKVFKAYGNESIQIVTADPYRLARDLHGVGFKSADSMAQKMGIPKESNGRIAAGIEYLLHELADEGHVCYPAGELLKLAEETLEVSQALIEPQLKNLGQEQRVEIAEMGFSGALETFVWLRPLFMAEIGICKQLSRLRRCPSHLRSVDAARALDWVQLRLQLQLAENQRQAVAQSLSEKLQIITGGPGTGKSTITKAILAIMEVLTDKIVLAAPTGRAAKRLSEITGKKARTIHSLLEYDFNKKQFKRGFDAPLDCDLIIIDESSMIDTYLMYSLLKAIPNQAKAIFLGDINQLPSVGPGNVLKDMLSSQCLPVTTLNQVFRQAAGSRIITNAHRINQGLFPDISNMSDSDFYFMEAETPEQVRTNILSLATQRLPKKYGFDPFTQIQVLAPMRKGIIGIDNLNTSLQELMNFRMHSQTEPLLWGGKRFLPGDKVMQIRNDHQREVYNGDIGRIASIDAAEQLMTVKIDERNVIYEFSDLDDLVLAYAVSVHKYQGSECPCIIMPLHTTHFKLLHRNLLYTGVTRGRQLVVLVGSKKALALAVKNDEVKRRYTGLQPALAGAFNLDLKSVV
jgi:exodeoxyribonuclease V alpha subunit